MKLITAVLKPFMLSDVKDVLKDMGVQGMTVTDSRGFGRQRGRTEVFRGSEYQIDFVPKVRIEVLADDDLADRVVEAIAAAAKTGEIGDGKIWVTAPIDVIRIRTGEQGDLAI